MDDMLTNNALELLGYSPILLLLNGFWMFSNKQMFGGVVNRIELSTDAMQTSHTFSDVFLISQASPMLLIAIPMIIIIFVMRFFYRVLEKNGFTITS